MAQYRLGAVCPLQANCRPSAGTEPNVIRQGSSSRGRTLSRSGLGSDGRDRRHDMGHGVGRDCWGLGWVGRGGGRLGGGPPEREGGTASLVTCQ